MNINNFSYGSLPNGSKVYLSLEQNGFFYSAYLGGQTGNILVIFRSLDPSLFKPTPFTVILKGNTVAFSTPTVITGNTNILGNIPVGYLSQNGTLIQSEPYYHTLTSDYNLNLNVVYSGISYNTTFFKPVLSKTLGYPTPIGGASNTETVQTIAGQTPFWIIPFSIPESKNTYFVPYVHSNGVCTPANSITELLRNWAYDEDNVGCTTGQPNGCIFTNKTECNAGSVPPYCVGTETCGTNGCVGLCTNGDTECIFTNTFPAYICTEPPPQPIQDDQSFWDKYGLWIILIIVIVVILIIFIAGMSYYNSKKVIVVETV